MNHKLSSSLVSRLSALHRGAGAFFGIFLFIILFSGSWSLGSDALRLWWNKAPLSGELLPLSQLMTLNQHATVIQLPQLTNPVITFCQGMGQCDKSYSAINGVKIEQNTPTMWLVTLHKNLFIDFPGRIFISLFGFALAVLLISGLIINRHRITSMMRLPRTTGLRLFLYDLHNWLGLWCYPWLILFAFTGAISGLGALGTVTLAQRAEPENPQIIMQSLMGGFHALDKPLAEIQITSPEQILNVLHQEVPSFIPQVLIAQEKSWIIGGVRQGQPATSNFEQYRFDLISKQFVGVRDSADHDFWIRGFIAIQPLHYGQYQWLPNAEKILSVMHFIAGLSACLLVASGLAMWCWRKMNSLSASFIVASCGGLVLSASLLLMLMPFNLSLQPIHFFLIWGSTVLVGTVIKNARLTLIYLMALIALILMVSFISSFWLQTTPFSRVDITLLIGGLFLLLALIWCRKLLCTSKSARS